MIAGDYFIVTMMALNFSAACAFAYHGLWIKSLYWLAACTLNFCVLRMQ